jgi:hypothetical protein
MNDERVSNSVYDCAILPCDTLTVEVHTGKPMSPALSYAIVGITVSTGETCETVWFTREKLRELADELTDLADELDGADDAEDEGEDGAPAFAVGDVVRIIEPGDGLYGQYRVITQDDGEDLRRFWVSGDGCYDARHLELVATPASMCRALLEWRASHLEGRRH